MKQKPTTKNKNPNQTKPPHHCILWVVFASSCPPRIKGKNSILDYITANVLYWLCLTDISLSQHDLAYV